MATRLRFTRLSLAALLLAAFSLVAAGPTPSAHACSCVVGVLSEQVERADVILLGVALDEESDGQGSAYTVGVKDIYKGEAQAFETVNTAANSAACGDRIPLGDDYLLFLQSDGDAYSTSLCSGNAPMSKSLQKKLEILTGPSSAPPEVERVNIAPELDETEERARNLLDRSYGKALAVGGGLLFLAIGLANVGYLATRKKIRHGRG